MPLILFFSFVVAPAVEIFLLVQVGQVVGAGWVFAELLAAAALGVYVMRRAGSSWWSALTGRTRTRGAVVTSGGEGGAGRTDGPAAGSAALLFLAGLMLFLPGLITDVVGLVLLVPAVRALLQASVAAWFTRRFTEVTGPGGVRLWTRSNRVVRGDVVREDVVREDEPGNPSGPPPALPPG